MALLLCEKQLIEGSHRDLQDYMHIICYYFYVFLRFFQNQNSRDFLFFCRVSYVFSNYGNLGWKL